MLAEFDRGLTKLSTSAFTTITRGGSEHELLLVGFCTKMVFSHCHTQKETCENVPEKGYLAKALRIPIAFTLFSSMSSPSDTAYSAISRRKHVVMTCNSNCPKSFTSSQDVFSAQTTNERLTVFYPEKCCRTGETSALVHPIFISKKVNNKKRLSPETINDHSKRH